MFNNASVLVTGGTGSFGQRFIQAVISRYTPRRLIVFSRDELKQYQLAQRFKNPAMRYFLGDIRDPSRLKRAFEGVDYIVHAAALKQVPALEYNPTEAVRTNIIGSENVISAALDAGVKKIVALSTDKAAEPINLYGATKLVADKLFIAANYIRGARDTSFSVVRYGNVMGSRGSVVPFFKQLIQEGARELPVTDERMTRFNITLDEGVDFVLKAFERMHGGELFIPKLPSLRVMDVVEALGAKAKIIGIRPGEKVHEVLCPSDISGTVLEFSNHYVSVPDQSYFPTVDFRRSGLCEEGAPVAEGFEYRSDTNPWFMSIPDIQAALAAQ